MSLSKTCSVPILMKHEAVIPSWAAQCRRSQGQAKLRCFTILFHMTLGAMCSLSWPETHACCCLHEELISFSRRYVTLRLYLQAPLDNLDACSGDFAGCAFIFMIFILAMFIQSYHWTADMSHANQKGHSCVKTMEQRGRQGWFNCLAAAVAVASPSFSHLLLAQSKLDHNHKWHERFYWLCWYRPVWYCNRSIT